MSDDIEAIEDTIPKLKAFYSTYNELSSEVDDLLEKMASFSVSAVSSDGLEAKSQELQQLEEAVNQRRSKLEDVLASCELLETPFDHSQFEENVSKLQDNMALCDKVSGCPAPTIYRVTGKFGVELNLVVLSQIFHCQIKICQYFLHEHMYIIITISYCTTAELKQCGVTFSLPLTGSC